MTTPIGQPDWFAIVNHMAPLSVGPLPSAKLKGASERFSEAVFARPS